MGLQVDGQGEGEHGAVVAIAGRQAPARLVSDCKGNRQSDAQSIADRFGGEERVEHFGQVLFGNAATVINDAQAPQLFIGFETDFQALAGFVLHCVQGIAQQVDQHLFQANRIAAHPGRARQMQHRADLLIAQSGVEQLY